MNSEPTLSFALILLLKMVMPAVLHVGRSTNDGENVIRWFMLANALKFDELYNVELTREHIISLCRLTSRIASGEIGFNSHGSLVWTNPTKLEIEDMKRL